MCVCVCMYVCMYVCIYVARRGATRCEDTLPAPADCPRMKTLDGSPEHSIVQYEYSTYLVPSIPRSPVDHVSLIYYR